LYFGNVFFILKYSFAYSLASLMYMVG